jgi:ABC-2 type transport system permease protein
MMRLLRSAFVIGRRDFGATVLSKALLFFLLGPVFPLLLGGVFGGIGARVASQTDEGVIAVVSSTADYGRMYEARERLANAMGDGVVRLVHYSPQVDLRTQEKKLLASRKPPVRAVLSGGLSRPHLIGAIGRGDPVLGQLNLILSDASRAQSNLPRLPVTEAATSSGAEIKDRAVTGQIGQMVLFFLTLFLAGMVMSQLIEEKSNKIIEVIAAAMPIDALFIGKLFAMLAASVIGIIVWVSAGALFIQMFTQGGVRALPAPAVGWGVFLTLGIIYFAMNYLLIGAVMLTIGAQASSAREVQILAMPATFGQFLIFGLASTVVGSPNAPKALAATLFPLSSPMAMLARAAQEPLLWPHLLAFVWQGLWVILILRLAAQMFRKTVLKSGPRSKWRRRAIKASEVAGQIT